METIGHKNIVVVGAGVSGLTTALLLCERPEYKVTVAAKHMPGDYHGAEYASPWAGANYLPLSQRGTPAAEQDAVTWHALASLARDSPEAGVHFQKIHLLTRKKDADRPSVLPYDILYASDPWWKTLFPDFRSVPKEELKGDIERATEFTSVCINTSIYLPWLVSRCLAKGVIFKRAVFKHVSDAAAPGVHHTGEAADLVLNCTGLSARFLGGVEDTTVVPARGQMVIVRNDARAMYGVSSTDESPDEMAYMMTRAAGGGTMLGGSYQKGSWDTEPDPNLATRIMRRCVEICPALTDGKGIEHLDVIRHSVGLRPVRLGGVRLEKEKINGVWVVHNYGHGGGGYQSSYGCSQEAVRLIDQALQIKARL